MLILFTSYDGGVRFDFIAKRKSQKKQPICYYFYVQLRIFGRIWKLCFCNAYNAQRNIPKNVWNVSLCITRQKANAQKQWHRASGHVLWIVYIYCNEETHCWHYKNKPSIHSVFFWGGIQGYVLVIKISVAKQEMLRMLIGGKWRSNVPLLHRSLFKTSVKSVTAVMD